MLNPDDDDFNYDEGGVWTRFWNKEFDGEPVWYIAAMAGLPFYFGLLVSRLHFADVVLLWILGFMIVGAAILLWTSFYPER